MRGSASRRPPVPDPGDGLIVPMAASDKRRVAAEDADPREHNDPAHDRDAQREQKERQGRKPSVSARSATRIDGSSQRKAKPPRLGEHESVARGHGTARLAAIECLIVLLL
jgi:hypothetical protein